MERFPGSPAYPATHDVVRFLEAAGVETKLLPATGALAAAVEEFERLTGRRMLATAEDESRFFDTPAELQRRLVIPDLAQPAEEGAVVYAPEGGSEQALTEGRDYRFLEYNARADGQPFTALYFTRRRWGPRPWPGDFGALRVTGRWGFSLTVPPLAWQAMVIGAIWRLFPMFRHFDTQGFAGIVQADVRLQFGVESFGAITDGWRRTWDEAVNRYRRVTL